MTGGIQSIVINDVSVVSPVGVDDEKDWPKNTRTSKTTQYLVHSHVVCSLLAGCPHEVMTDYRVHTSTTRHVLKSRKSGNVSFVCMLHWLLQA